MNYYGISNSTDHLAHYGVKGMRWGVRRALATGNQRALDRHYRKAAKKLAKLQSIGDHGYKSAAKAAAYGAAAAGTGALAIGGTGLAAKGIRGARKGIRFFGNLATGNKFRQLSSLERAADAVDKWGKKHTVGFKAADIHDKLSAAAEKGFSPERLARRRKLIMRNNSQYARLGALAATAALAAKAGQHAYRAHNSEKYREKAERFRNEMDKVFAGTDYEGQYAKISRRQQKRRRTYYT